MKTPLIVTLSLASVLTASVARSEDKVLGPIIAIKRTTKIDPANCTGKWLKDQAKNLFCNVDATLALENQWVGQTMNLVGQVGDIPVNIVATLTGYRVIMPKVADKLKPEDADETLKQLLEVAPAKELEIIVYAVKEEPAGK